MDDRRATLQSNVEDALPTPPYRRYASSSNLQLDDVRSPEYDSDADTMAVRPREKSPDNHADHNHPPPTKPSVHYPDDLHVPAPGYRDIDQVKMPRVDSADPPSSRAPSLAGTDDDGEDEDYDWSDEEDLVDEEAKFEKKMGVKTPQSRWRFMRIINFFLSTVVGSTITSGLIAVGPILLHIFYLNPHRTPRRQYVNDNVSAWLFWVAANLLISWYLALTVDVVPVVFTWIVSLAWGHVSEDIKTRVELYNSIKDTFKPVLYAASGWVSWVILFANIYNLYDLNDDSLSRASYTQRIYQVISFLFFFALVICAQRMLSHMIAFSFHRVAFQDRIEAVKTALATIDHLRDYKPKRAQRSSRVFSSFGIGFGGQAHTGGATERTELMNYSTHTSHDGTPERMDSEDEAALEMGQRKGKARGRLKREQSGLVLDRPQSRSRSRSREGVPATRGDAINSALMHTYPPRSHLESPLAPASPHRANTPRLSVDEDGGDTLAIAARALKSAVLHDARNMTGASDEPGGGGLGWNVNTAHEAKRLAKAIYLTFKADRKRKYLVPQDFYTAYPTTAEAEAAFRVFDKDDNGDISRAEIKTTVLKVYKERRFLSRSMRDVGAALGTLDHVLLVFALTVLFFISLSVFNVSVGGSLTSLYSLGIAASFIFRNAASSAFDAIMFLFVTHPYDTGDRCFIDNENLVVKKMGLFATIFTRSDGTETYYFNSQLFSKFITNIRRSGNTFENLTMQVAWRTPLEKLDALEKCMNEWLQTEENRWFEPSTGVTLQKIIYQRHLEITLGIGHNGTWQVSTGPITILWTTQLLTQTLNQDWGLRNARKTAFHAAVNFYSRRLGITATEAPQPIAYVDQPPPSPTDCDADAGIPMSPAPEGADDAATGVKPVLGFLPPPAERSTLLRARKSRAKKAFRGVGVGDG